MADFYQTGVISTLHRYSNSAKKLEKMEAELKKFSRQQPVTLLLPSLWSEFEGPAMPKIVEQLQAVKYLRQIVLVLDRANHEQFKKAKGFFENFTTPVRILWNDSPRIVELYAILEGHNIPAGPQGKGRSVWMGMGYILSDEKSYAIALHDCDILTYSRAKGLYMNLAGGVLRADDDSNDDVYGKRASLSTILTGRDLPAPTEAQGFLDALSSLPADPLAASPRRR